MFKEINGLTIDFKNKLIWGPVQGLMTWNQAKDLEKDSWRLPVKDELKQAFFDKVPGFTEDRFWSSSSFIDNADHAWYVDFDNGYVVEGLKTYRLAARYIRPFDSLILKELNFTMEIL